MTGEELVCFRWSKVDSLDWHFTNQLMRWVACLINQWWLDMDRVRISYQRQNRAGHALATLGFINLVTGIKGTVHLKMKIQSSSTHSHADGESREVSLSTKRYIASPQTSVAADEFGIFGFPETWITLKELCLEPFMFLFCCFLHFKTSPLLQSHPFAVNL